MFEIEIQKYIRLNALARPCATVLFGSGTDTDLPIAEIASAMDTDMKFYNRSIEEISVKDAAAYCTAVIASAMGLPRIVKNNKSLHDLARMIYCCHVV